MVVCGKKEDILKLGYHIYKTAKLMTGYKIIVSEPLTWMLTLLFYL